MIMAAACTGTPAASEAPASETPVVGGADATGEVVQGAPYDVELELPGETVSFKLADRIVQKLKKGTFEFRVFIPAVGHGWRGSRA